MFVFVVVVVFVFMTTLPFSSSSVRPVLDDSRHASTSTTVSDELDRESLLEGCCAVYSSYVMPAFLASRRTCRTRQSQMAWEAKMPVSRTMLGGESVGKVFYLAPCPCACWPASSEYRNRTTYHAMYKLEPRASNHSCATVFSPWLAGSSRNEIAALTNGHQGEECTSIIDY